MSDRLGELEMLSRCRELTAEESDELARIVRNERRRQRYRANQPAILARLRHRYYNDEQFRRRVIDARVKLFRKRAAERRQA